MRSARVAAATFCRMREFIRNKTMLLIVCSANDGDDKMLLY